MLISFWSTHHGQTGSTNNLIVLSLAIAMSEKAKVLVSHSQYGENQLERALVSDIDSYMEDSLCNYGLEPVIRLTKNGLLSIDNLSDYTIPLLKNHAYDLLAGIRRKLDGAQENAIYENALLKSLELANQKYDYVFVDIASGFLNELSRKIIEISDLVVININQNQYVLDSLKKSEWISQISEKTMYCIGKYDPGIKANAKNICRKYKLGNVIRVPYSPQLIDLTNRGEILELFGRNILDHKRSKSEFFKEVLLSAQEIVKKGKKRK